MKTVIHCNILSCDLYLTPEGLATDMLNNAREYLDRHDASFDANRAREEWAKFNAGPLQYDWAPIHVLSDGTVVR